MKTGKFVYAKRTPEQFKAAANRRGGGFDSYLKRDFKRYKMRDGKNLIRFLPPTWDVDPKTGKSKSDDYNYMFWLNYDIGPDKTSYLSLASMGKGADPLDEARREAMHKGDQALVKSLTPSPRWLAWVIDRQAPEEGPQLFDFPGKLRTAINTASQDEDTNELVYVDSPTQGADVRFYKEGQGKTGTSYPGEKVKVLKPTPLSEDGAEADAWLDFVIDHPIPDCLNFYDYDHISMVYNGAVAAKDEDEEDDNQPAPKAANTDEDETPPWKKSRVQRGAEEEAPDAEEEAPLTKTTSDDDEDDSGSLKERLRRRRERLQGEKA